VRRNHLSATLTLPYLHLFAFESLIDWYIPNRDMRFKWLLKSDDIRAASAITDNRNWREDCA
jgi:hypothetical protein